MAQVDANRPGFQPSGFQGALMGLLPMLVWNAPLALSRIERPLG